jgi:hypothetical protein
LGEVELVRDLRMAAGQLVGSEIHGFHTWEGTDIYSSFIYVFGNAFLEMLFHGF